MADIGAARKLYAGSPLGHSLHILFFFLIKHAKKKFSSWQQGFFFFFLLPLFVVHLSLHWRSVYFAQENEGPKRHCSACKVLWKGLEEEKGRNFQAF